MFSLPVHHVAFLSPGIFEIALERCGYVFTPGECAVLFSDSDSRPYSLSSAPHEDVLRFLIRRIDGGVVSPWLAARRRGDEVGISTPFGHFRPGQCGPAEVPAVFAATGVGIAPFLSFLRSRPTAGAARKPVAFYGVRTLSDAVELDFLRGATDLRLAVSRETVPGCHHGHVTELMATVPHDARTHFFLCGIDGMVDDAARLLDAQGVGPERVHTEVFFSSSASR